MEPTSNRSQRSVAPADALALSRRLALVLCATGVGIAAVVVVLWPGLALVMRLIAAGAAAGAAVTLWQRKRIPFADLLLAAFLCLLGIAAPSAELVLPAIAPAAGLAALAPSKRLGRGAVAAHKSVDAVNASAALIPALALSVGYLVALVPDLPADAAHAFAALLPAALLPGVTLAVAHVRERFVAHRGVDSSEGAIRRASANLAAARTAADVQKELVAAVDDMTTNGVAMIVRDEHVVTANVPELEGRWVGQVPANGAGPSRVAASAAPEALHALDTVNGVQRPQTLLTSSLRVGDADHGLAVVATDTPSEAQALEGLAVVTELATAALEKVACRDALHPSDARLAAMVTNSVDVIAVVGVDGVLTYASPSVQSLLGQPPEAIIGRRFEELTRPEDAERVRAFVALAADEGGVSTGRIKLRHSDGSWRYCEARGQRLRSGCGQDCTIHGHRAVEIVMNIHDVTDRVSLEDELAHRAFHDSLTDLPNRALLTNRLEQALRAATRSHHLVAVLFCDLDDFKAVNDTLGHQFGDELLVDVGRRLKDCIRPGDTGARLGGDEFAILLEDIGDTPEAERVAQRILHQLGAPFALAGNDVSIGVSVGVAVGTAEDTAGDLLRKADIAMYMAKRRGKHRYEIFVEEGTNDSREKLRRLAELERALERGEFVAHYQPTIDLDAGRIVGVEALVRWQHPELGLLGPEHFIPLAEECGLVVAIGRWVLREACGQVAQWQRELGDAAPKELSVNLSAAQLARDDFVLEVSEALDDSHMSHGSLTLEITESGLMSDLTLTSRRLSALKRLGVNLAVDDFGTGYSSLAYLQQFPIDTLKIDRSFVDHVDGSAENAALAKAIVRLGHELNLRTIAEGIERLSQVEALRRMHCPVGQGFYFAGPLCPEEIERLFRAAHAGAGR